MEGLGVTALEQAAVDYVAAMRRNEAAEPRDWVRARCDLDGAFVRLALCCGRGERACPVYGSAARGGRYVDRDGNTMRVAYADPPYLGCCGLYEHRHEAPYGCWDDPHAHRQLIANITRDYDGFVLHASVPSLVALLSMLPDDCRTMAWVKPFAAFKRNVPVAYAWEPVIVKACRKPEVTGRMVMRDWIDEPITMERGFPGAKPERVCMWAFEMAGMQPDDELVDLFRGSGAVSRAWEKWRMQFDFAPAGVAAESFPTTREAAS